MDSNITIDNIKTNKNKLTDSATSPNTKIANAHVEFNVRGMNCAACVNRVETALTKINGVLDANVNLSTEKATVKFVPNLVIVNDLIVKVEEAGYQATPIKDETKEFDLEKKQEYSTLLRKLIFSLFLTVFIFTCSMPEVFTFYNVIPEHLRWILLFILTSLIILFSGSQFYISAWKALIHGTADMNTLISVGTGAAYLYSTAATLATSFDKCITISVTGCISFVGGLQP